MRETFVVEKFISDAMASRKGQIGTSAGKSKLAVRRKARHTQFGASKYEPLVAFAPIDVEAVASALQIPASSFSIATLTPFFIWQ